MSLPLGTRLGNYEILASIGRGGMGEVYRARDARLDRDVAIKISTERFTERFDRESRAIAALNHPNICTLFDVGTAPEAPGYLVMEYIEGESPRGPLPVDTVLDYARQIGAALEDAHAKGVVHRDLKPGNIKVTPGGLVKVLDFGLAKMNPGAAADVDLSPTVALSMTEAGVILGTAAYMAPEQARGKPVDRRADIWAFGVVLHELLTGRPLFKGSDVSETLASVIKETPSWDGVPARMLPLLQACLEKDPARRLRDIGDAWRLVEMGSAIERATTAAATQAPVPAPRARAAWPAWAVAGLMAAALATVAGRHLSEGPAAQPEVRFQVPVPSSGQPGALFGFRLSPDGQTLAMVSAHEGTRRLYVRRLDTLSLRAVPGTEGAADIFWSPDSAYIGFFANGKLKRVGLDGRAPRELADAALPRGGAWNRDGVILFADGPGVPLKRVSAEGATPEPVTRVGALEGDRYPEFLPDQNHFLYFHATDNTKTEGVYLASLDGRTAARRILEEAGNVAFVPGPTETGHLLYLSQGGLVARAFDASRLQFVGGPEPLADSVRQGFNNIYWGSFSAGAGGLAFWTGPRRPVLDIAWLDSAGTRTRITDGVGSAHALSPDGGRLAFNRDGSSLDPDLWVLELATGRSFRAAAGVTSSAWSPDGQELVFASRTAVLTSVYRVRADGGSTPERLGPLGLNAGVYRWSPDGKWLLAGSEQASDIAIFSMEAGHTVTSYLKTPATEAQASLSPDGKWVAYTSTESAVGSQPGVFVQAMPITSARYPIAAGAWPRWSRDGRFLYFVQTDGRQRALMVVPISTAAGFQAGTPRKVLDLSGTAGAVELAPDGRFIAAIPRPAVADPPITVVLNWKP